MQSENPIIGEWTTRSWAKHDLKEKLVRRKFYYEAMWVKRNGLPKNASSYLFNVWLSHTGTRTKGGVVADREFYNVDT